MAFWFHQIKTEIAKAPKKINRKDIPIASLRELGCSVCPRDEDDSMKTPKMRPSGPKRPMVYLLGGSPSKDEDMDDMHWTDKAGHFIYKTFGAEFMDRNVRSNFITQCKGPQTPIEIECCRNRIVADIEQTKPLIIVGIGDEPMRWATGMANNATTLLHRGSRFVVKIGSHVCWFVPIIYPNFVNKKQRGNEFELAMTHDINMVKSWCEGNGIDEPRYYSAPYDTNIEYINGNLPGDMDRLRAALKKLAKAPKSSIDIETTGLRPYLLKDPRILTVALGTFDHVVVFPVDHRAGWGTRGQVRMVKFLLAEYLMDSGVKCCHNLAFEMEWFEFEFGSRLLRRTEWDDTMCMCHTLDERKGTKSLGHQTLLHFGFNVKTLSDLDQSRLEDYPLMTVMRYNGLDTKWTDKLRDHLQPMIDADPKYVLEYERKLRLAPTLVITETVGLDVDMIYAADKKKELLAKLADIEFKINGTDEVRKYKRRFGTFSPTNPDHVLKLMKDICQRDEVRVVDRKSGDESWTSGEEALMQIPAEEVPSAPLVLEHRGLAKLVSTYLEPILTRAIVCRDGKVRTKYASTVAETGRLNSESPNIQNFPKRKHKDIRGVIRAAAGKLFFAADYGQIEFRVVGMASEDPNLVKYCWTGYDVHGFWAGRMLKEYPEIVDYICDNWAEDIAKVAKVKGDEDAAIKKIWRQEAKNGWVFPQLFGSSVASCAAQLHLPMDIAEDLGKEFWDEFRVVKKWQEKLLRSYNKNLYVETLSGRRRRGSLTPNQVINVPIQGSACDIVTKGMEVCSEYAEEMEDPELNPVLNIHDDLTFEMYEDSVEAKMPVIASIMCKPRFDFINVPLIVECSTGRRWSDLNEIKKYSSEQLFNLRNPYK